MPGKRIEIGSFLESWGGYRSVFDWYNEVRGNKGGLLFDFCKSAIIAAVMSIENRRPCMKKTVLVPEYTCTTVIELFEYLGFKIHVFPIKKDLSPKKKELCDLVELVKPDILFFHTYYGVDTMKSARDWLMRILQCSYSDRPYIIEDFTQSMFLANNYGADFVVGSFRKWFGVADGGFLIAEPGLMPDIDISVENEAFIAKRCEAMEGKRRYLDGLGDDKQKFLRLNRESEDIHDKSFEIYGISKQSLGLLGKIDVDACMQSRKENACYLERHIPFGRGIHKVFGDISGASPLYYPVYVDDRVRVQKYLSDRNIYTSTIWGMEDKVKDAIGLSEDGRWVYGHILAIPCDQRYGEKDMERICEEIGKCVGTYGM